MPAANSCRQRRHRFALRASPVRLCEPHFDDQPRCNDAECSERSYDYAKDKLTGFAPSRLYRCVLKTRILLRKPVLSLDTLFSRQVSHVADPKLVPDLGSTEALKASAILVRYCHLSRFASAGHACAFSQSSRSLTGLPRFSPGESGETIPQSYSIKPGVTRTPDCGYSLNPQKQTSELSRGVGESGVLSKTVPQHSRGPEPGQCEPPP
jgi:hypothetical protein